MFHFSDPHLAPLIFKATFYPLPMPDQLAPRGEQNFLPGEPGVVQKEGQQHHPRRRVPYCRGHRRAHYAPLRDEQQTERGVECQCRARGQDRNLLTVPAGKVAAEHFVEAHG